MYVKCLYVMAHESERLTAGKSYKINRKSTEPNTVIITDDKGNEGVFVSHTRGRLWFIEDKAMIREEKINSLLI